MSNNQKVNELYAVLKSGVDSLYDSQAWKEFLKVQSLFHKYSWRNTILIYLQCPHATRILGFKEWKKVKRFVQRGEKAIKIWAPSIKIEKDEETEEEVPKVNGYYPVSVFDISQTGGEELPTLTPELKMETEELKSFYETLKSICEFPIEETTLSKGIKGSYSPVTDQIKIKKGMASLHKCKTLIHEMSHAYLHKNSSKTRGMEEVEAEGTAYVVLSYFGFDTSQYSFGYVAGWNGSKESKDIESAASTIQKTACQIIEMIEKERNQSAKQVA
ncbi:ArdC-like ssDNA-binding domain-containing protein [Paenibacillus agilis]|uniref:N-terminal domain-containing protein n=1 Tax=Paenibacillus agilis TaxID=3020863 RepID=A0A559IDF3_9BACL|nr:ArdC-like ssDNA-binding domain-containing protein [Paenibacillus agilis]TVX85560.1 hypothetical protein FPZ44_24705 [Paenibacillus agilis]